MSKDKSKKPDADKRVRKLEKVAKDKSRPKKERKAAQAELDALRGVFVPTEAIGAGTGEPSSPSVEPAAPATSPDASGFAAVADMAQADLDRHAAWRAKQDAEVAAQWAHQRAITERDVEAKGLGKRAVTLTNVPEDVAAGGLLPDLVTTESRRAADVHNYRLGAPFPADRIDVDEDGVIRFRPAVEAIVADAIQRLEAPAQEAVEVQTEEGREFAVGSPGALDKDVLEKPTDPVLTNGNGQAMIHYRDPATGKEKVKGYTRVTTYIDCLDDKAVLNKWKHRTLLEGGAVELLQADGSSPSLEAVARSVKRTDEALADIDRRTREEGELLELRRQEVQKEHRDTLERIAEDLMELGGAHEAANKGTDLHRLIELVNNGQALPEGTTASDRRDVDAYQRAMAKLDAKVLWTERRVVLDDLQVSGTMDLALLVKLPGMARRIRVVGDVKTGRVDYAPGKIGMQQVLYARGEGYDWTKPLERERLGLSQHHGLLIHLPQGEGRCSIYLLDLDLAAQGIALARQVREWRNTSKRIFDLKSPLQAVEVAEASQDQEPAA